MASKTLLWRIKINYLYQNFDYYYAIFLILTKGFLMSFCFKFTIKQRDKIIKKDPISKFLSGKSKIN